MRRERFFLLDLLQGLWRLLAEAGQPPTVAITELSQHRTELQVGPHSLVLDTRSKLITRNGARYLRFDEIRSIDVVYLRPTEDRPERWKVKLRTSTVWAKTLLTTTDDADASILAARLSTLTGRRVYSY